MKSKRGKSFGSLDNKSPCLVEASLYGSTHTLNMSTTDWNISPIPQKDLGKLLYVTQAYQLFLCIFCCSDFAGQTWPSHLWRCCYNQQSNPLTKTLPKTRPSVSETLHKFFDNTCVHRYWTQHQSRPQIADRSHHSPRRQVPKVQQSPLVIAWVPLPFEIDDISRDMETAMTVECLSIWLLRTCYRAKSRFFCSRLQVPVRHHF